MKPRVGLAGFSAGSIYHAPLIAASGGELVAISTANPGRIAQARAEYPAAQIVPDLEALLGLDLDLIVLTTPTNLHYQHVAQVIAAGVPCVVEKPVTVRLEQAEELVAAATEAQVPVTVYQNRRFDEGVLTAKRLVDSGELGPIHRFDFHWERWRPVPKDRWRENADWTEGGGLLLDIGPHLVDTAILLFGPVSEVIGEVRSVVTPADDDVFIALRHESGVLSHLSAATCSAMPLPRIRVLGRKAAYLYTDFEENATAYPKWRNTPGNCGWLVAGEQRDEVPREPGDYTDFYRAVFAALALPTAKERQAGMPVTLAEALAVMRVLDAARR